MTPATRFCLLSIVAAIFLLPPNSARGETWTPMGPPGGDVRSLAADPRDAERIYLGTAHGLLYRSSDGGSSWERLSPGFPLRGYSLDEISVDWRGIVLVGYWEVNGNGGGVARSSDGGETFSILPGIEGESVRGLAVAPSNPKVIAAGTLTGVYMSRDDGRHWKRITPEGHPDLVNVESLVFDPANSRTLYAGTWHLAWKTEDAGVSWQPVHEGMIDDSHVMTLTLDRLDSGTVYATACSGIYRFTDSAGRWSKIGNIPYSSRRTRAFFQGPVDPDYLLAGTTEGLWISRDGGRDWKQVTANDLIVNAVLVRPDETILIGTERAGVFRSSDRGRTWTAANEGFSERFVADLVFDRAGGRMLAAVWGDGRHAGVFASSGAGKTWTRLARGLEGRQVLSLVLLGRTLIVGTDAGVFSRAAGAKAWTLLPMKSGPRKTEPRKTEPRVTELVVLSSRGLLAATSEGLLRSADGGRSWTKAMPEPDDEVLGLAVSPGDPRVVVAATRFGVSKSRDGGVTWSRAAAKGWDGVTPHSIAFLPTDHRVLFATTTGGLFRSGDLGVTWERVGGGIPHSDLTGLALHPDGRTIYASDFTWGGVFRSLDAGASWERMPTDGLASDRVWTMGIDPADPDRLLVASPAGGLHLHVSPSSSAARTAAPE